MTWFWLRVLDLLKPLFTWQGVDYVQLRAIVGTKLVMDNRRPFSLRVQQQQKESSSSFIYTMLFGALIGFVISFVISSIPSLIISFTIYHSFLIVMIMMLLISDFSSVLLDTSDNTIILPRPISAKTFFAARITHILIYIGQLAFSLSIIPIGVTFFTYGKWIGVALIVTTLLSIMLAVALTNGLYLLIMRFTSEERLKTIINYFQIFITLFVMVGYQLLPRLLSFSNFAETTDDFQWWALLVPPMWMTAVIKLASNFSPEWIDLSLTALAIIAPVLMWKLVTKYLSPHFTTKLSDLGTGSSGVFTNAPIKGEEKSILNIKEWITKSGLERASYGLVWSALKYDRKLKLRVYPALGSIVIFILLPIIQSNKKNVSLQEIFRSLNQTQTHLLAIYASIFILISVIYEIQFTDEFKAAWIYLSAPVKKPGVILSGALKAMVVKFFFPIYSITGLLILSIWGSKAIVDVAFGMIACLLLIITISVVSEKRLPLSMALTTRNQAASFTRAIVSILIIGAVGFGHYILSKFTLILWIACPIMAASCYFIWRLYSNATWEDVEI